jgi:hypothetical protein
LTKGGAFTGAVSVNRRREAMKLTALDQIHISSVQRDTIVAGQYHSAEQG